jgi:hypothetical protein
MQKCFKNRLFIVNELRILFHKKALALSENIFFKNK